MTGEVPDFHEVAGVFIVEHLGLFEGGYDPGREQEYVQKRAKLADLLQSMYRAGTESVASPLPSGPAAAPPAQVTMSLTLGQAKQVFALMAIGEEYADGARDPDGSTD